MHIVQLIYKQDFGTQTIGFLRRPRQDKVLVEWYPSNHCLIRFYI